MRILLAPDVMDTDPAMSRLPVQNIIDLFFGAGHEVAVCVPADFRFRHASLYETRRPASRLLARYRPVTGRSAEEYMYHQGLLDSRWLSRDIEDIRQAVRIFQADLVIAWRRPSALAAARLEKCRCWVFAHTALVRSRRFDPVCIAGLNETLADCGLEQVLALKDLYACCEKRLAFGPTYIQPFPEDVPVERFGSFYPLPLAHTPTAKVSIQIGECTLKPRRIRKIIEEAFLEAPYHVEAYYPGCEVGQNGNIRFLGTIRPTSAADAKVCIHDGSENLFSYCLALGVPQVLINDGSWLRNWNCATACRAGIALSINENRLSMESLYETYRQLLADDCYTEQAALTAAEIRQMGGLEKLLSIL